MRLDALIFGGGAAGLWLLDRLSRDGHHVLLLEAHALGHGQTVASQGIIHGGLKYTLSGLLTQSARNIREMPNVWRDSLMGRSTPHLVNTRVRSDCCYLWQTDSMASRAGMIGARLGLRVKPETIEPDARPEVLDGVYGTVARLPEQVISPQSFIQDLATQYRDRILLIDSESGLDFDLNSPGEVAAVRLTSPTDGARLCLQPRQVIFTAGAGNAHLRKRVGLSSDVMQRRPLHMVMLRGNLPELNGHCLDGAKTRVTITSDVDSQGRMVWQVGGQIAEDGVQLSPLALTEHAIQELHAVLPSIDLTSVEWSTYRVDRAEGAVNGGSRPETIQVLCAGNVTTGWPTKLVLAPVLAHEIASRATSPYLSTSFDTREVAAWPRPPVATVPWESAGLHWWKLEQAPMQSRQRAA
ncbi:FAD-dependent oxidoreductase [Schlesneria sp.]|uniref:FAD-dependent oxidoreductase n=1 Tax=Schlesneria sp. TaxID=2762018 RepID=UPI002F203FBD